MSDPETPATPEPDDAPGSDPEATAAPRSSRRPWYLWAGIAAALIVVVVVVALVARPSDPTYDDASRDRFLESCTRDGGDPARPTCECLYGRIVASVPYDRFELVNEDLARQLETLPEDEPLELPDDFQVMLDECIAETSATG